jgi:hypothetical protein
MTDHRFSQQTTKLSTDNHENTGPTKEKGSFHINISSSRIVTIDHLVTLLLHCDALLLAGGHQLDFMWQQTLNVPRLFLMHHSAACPIPTFRPKSVCAMDECSVVLRGTIRAEFAQVAE